MKVIDFNQLDISKITYEKPEKIRGSFISKAFYDGEPIYIKTPEIKNVSGIVHTETKTYLDLEFDDSNIHLYNFLSSFDENNITQININSKDWFSKEFPLDVIEDFYMSPLKHRNVPRFRLKMPVLKGKNECIIYDCENNLISDLNKNNKVISILQFLGLRFLKQQVICEWVPLQIKTNDSNHLVKDSIEYLISDNFTNTELTEITQNDESNDTAERNNIDIDNEEIIPKLENNTYDLNHTESLEEIKNELNKYKSSYEQKELELSEFKNKLKSFLEIN